MKTASWVIVDKKTNEVLFETFQESILEKINTEKFKIVPILEYLVSINGQTK